MDIVDRLRFDADCTKFWAWEAADEITRLRQEVQQQSDNYARALQVIAQRDREILELQSAVVAKDQA